MNSILKKASPYLISIAAMLLVACIYFTPILKGKVHSGHDYKLGSVFGKEARDYNEEIGRYPLWSNHMFSGMPGNTIVPAKGNLLKPFFKLTYFKSVGNALGTTFCCMLGMFLLLCVLGVNPYMAATGGILFGLSTVNVLWAEAGHGNKVVAIAYMPMVLAGYLLIFKQKYWWGLLVASIGFCFEFASGHLQMTYYLFFILLCFGVFQLVQTIKSKNWEVFGKAVSIGVLALLLGILPNTSMLWLTQDYASESIRGEAILPQEDKAAESGLDKDYVFNWSYGITESINFLIPRFMGGGSSENVGKNSKSYKAMKKIAPQQAKAFVKAVPTYWGNQPFVSGPFYLGACLIAFFIFGLVSSKNNSKWWLLAGAIILLIIAWGKNFAAINYLLYDYFPYFNKFRAYTSSISGVHLCLVALAFLGVNAVINIDKSKQQNQKLIFVIFGGLAAFCALIAFIGPNVFDFESLRDQQLRQYNYPVDAIIADRISMMRTDALRSAVFILASGALVWAWYKSFFNKKIFIAAISLVMLADVVLVSQRYFNSDDFENASSRKKALMLTAVDKEILKDNSYYRVWDTTVSSFNDNAASAHHKNIGGYYAAKLRRYQDLIDRHLGQANSRVLDMLNTKYIIQKDNSGSKRPVLNSSAMGPAWFVNNYQMVATHLEEIDNLADFEPKNLAFIHQEFSDYMQGLTITPDPTASIKLTRKIPDDMAYEVNCQSEQLAIFSEIWYKPQKGMKAFIDGKEVDFARANYVLRALRVPAGKHTIEFKYQPTPYYLGGTISYIGSFLLIGLLFFVLYLKRGAFLTPNQSSNE